MKQILLTILFSLTIGAVFPQSILPDRNSEFCPNVEYTFTVTISKTFSSVTGEDGALVTQSPSTPVGSTFTFKGKFNDVNRKQTFRIRYSDNSSTPFEFKRIKSLFFGACTFIQPNRLSITAEPCQNQSFSINFNNLQWKTEFESPSLCFGSISTYEYLLPNGWQLGSQTSNGSTWLQANNSVTITADATTGHGQYVQIRAKNTSCASSVQGSIIYIPINRPAPTLEISGSTNLCSPNNYNYTLTGAPTGSTISWSNTNSYYNLTSSGNTANVTPTSIANGSTTINATVTLSCGLSYNVQKTISIGAPYVNFNIASYPYPEQSCYEIWGIYTFQAQQSSGYPNSFTGYSWGWRNLTNNTVSTDPTIYGSQYTFIPEEAGDYEIWVRATNSCGSGILESVKQITVSNACFGGRTQEAILDVYPNPIKDKVTVLLPANFRRNTILQISNQSGVVLFSQKVNTGNEKLVIDLSRFKVGLYQLTIRSGNEVRQAKLIKQ